MEPEASTLATLLVALAGGGGPMAPTSAEVNRSSCPPLDALLAAGNASVLVDGVGEECELQLLNFPSKREDLSTAIPLTAIFALLLVTGCVGNLCTAIVIARPKNKYMHTATNYYLFSLAMSDFLFLILGLPQEMYTIWQRYPYAFGEAFCIARGYLSEASTYASILTISAFTIERYVAICHPLWAHTMSQLPRAVTSIVIIWCLAAVCAVPPAAELGIIKKLGPLTNRTLEQSAQCATKRTLYENMFALSAIVFFIVPMVIVTVLYILIALELRRSSRMNAAISKQTSAAQRPSLPTPLAHAPSCPLSRARPPPSSRSQQQLAAAAAGKQAPASGSLMARLMSQRPSSAIGSFEGQSAGGCGCRCHQSVNGRSARADTERAQVSSSSLADLTGASSSGRQQQQASGANQIMCAAGSKTSGAPAHPPLSYHESLMQRQLSQQVARANGKLLHPLASCKSPLSRSTSRQSCATSAGSTQVRASAAAKIPLAGQQQHQSRRSRAVASSKKSVVRMLVAVVVSFFICWVPFHAQRLLASYLAKDENQNQFLLDMYLKLTYISGIMYYLSSTINPLLYQLMSAKFRLAFKETFNCSLLRCAIFAAKSPGAAGTSCAHQPPAGHSPTNSLKDRRPASRATSRQLSHCDSRNSDAASASVWPPPADAPLECTCSDAHAHPRHPRAPPLGVIARLRGRLGDSVGSLLGLSGARADASSAATPCVLCTCSSPEEQEVAAPSSSPLLAAEENQATGEGARLEFPAHSLLKFVRSPSGLSCALVGGAGGQCLTRLSSHGDEEQEPHNRLDSLIRSADDDADPTPRPATATTSGESGNSTGSSPDAQQTGQAPDTPRALSGRRELGGERRQHREVRIHSSEQQHNHRRVGEELSAGSSSSGQSTASAAKTSRPNQAEVELASSRRRRSLQQMHNAHLPKLTAADVELEPADDAQSRRLSGASNSRHLSFSLSNSERQLDKKLSLSTTMSALEDYGSYTTTNSQLTGVGSSARLSTGAASRRDSYALTPSDSASSSSVAAGDEDSTTVITRGELAANKCRPVDEGGGESLVPLLADASCSVASSSGARESAGRTRKCRKVDPL